MQLTQKETELLKDLKSEEKLCAEKYEKHSEAANDEQLKSLFSDIAKVERGHLNMLEQIEQGTVPTVSGGSATIPTFTATYGIGETEEKSHDCYLCSDVLTIEKHASSLYNTCIFEFKEENLRNVLNSIQTAEQNHGKMIYDYMSKNSMYS